MPSTPCACGQPRRPNQRAEAWDRDGVACVRFGRFRSKCPLEARLGPTKRTPNKGVQERVLPNSQEVFRGVGALWSRFSDVFVQTLGLADRFPSDYQPKAGNSPESCLKLVRSGQVSIKYTAHLARSAPKRWAVARSPRWPAPHPHKSGSAQIHSA